MGHHLRGHLGGGDDADGRPDRDEEGADGRERAFWEFDVGAESATVVSADPYRLRVTVREAGDALHLTVDDDLHVVETDVAVGAGADD